MAERASRGTVVFDIIGTCFSLSQVADALSRAGAPPHALPLWFARSLRDGFALSHAGGYQPLKAVLEAELARTLRQLQVAATPEQVGQITGSFGQLEPQPGFSELVAELAGDGWRILALTNSSSEATKGLLERAGALQHFSALLSCDQVQKTKPHPDVYELARREAQGDVWMVAAHAWDIQGAIRAGFRTIFISDLEGGYLEVYPEPDVTVARLSEVGSALRAAAAVR
jgi:2-haloacid dehalogenase